MSQSILSNEDLIKEDILYSQRSVPSLKKHIRYSRHLSFQHERISSNGRSQLVIHATIQSSTNNRHSKEKKSINPDRDLNSISTILTTRYHQDEANNSDRISNLDDEITQSARRSLSIIKDFRQHQSIPKSIDSNWKDNDIIRSFHEPNVEKVSKREYFSSYSNREKKDWGSNTNDFHKDSKKTKKKRRKKYLCGCPCSCSCLLASLFTALLLSIAIAAALVATLIKPQTITTTTTQSTTPSTFITTSTTQTTTSITTATVSTSSTSTAVTTTSCNTPTTTIVQYSGLGTHTPTFNYTALSTGTVVLEFGFSSTGSNKIGYLDDVSVIDTNASNTEMLINGDFENGTLIGWQVVCTSGCNPGSSGNLSSSSCNVGFCYSDGCQGALDFVQQTFTTIIGHVYILSFWLTTANTQTVYVSIS